MRKVISLLVFLILLLTISHSIILSSSAEPDQILYDVRIDMDEREFNFTIEVNQSVTFSFHGNVTYESYSPMSQEVHVHGWVGNTEEDRSNFTVTMEPEIMVFTGSGTRPYTGTCEVPPTSYSHEFHIYAGTQTDEGYILHRFYITAVSSPVIINVLNNSENETDLPKRNKSNDNDDNTVPIMLITSIAILATVVVLYIKRKRISQWRRKRFPIHKESENPT